MRWLARLGLLVCRRRRGRPERKVVDLLESRALDLDLDRLALKLASDDSGNQSVRDEGRTKREYPPSPLVAAEFTKRGTAGLMV